MGTAECPSVKGKRPCQIKRVDKASCLQRLFVVQNLLEMGNVARGQAQCVQLGEFCVRGYPWQCCL